MLKKSFIIILSLLAIFSFILPIKAQVSIDNPITSSTFEELIDKIINFIFYFGILAAPIMFIVSGIFFITAAGNPEKIQKARNVALWTGIGLALIIMAKGIVIVLQDIFS